MNKQTKTETKTQNETTTNNNKTQFLLGIKFSKKIVESK